MSLLSSSELLVAKEFILGITKKELSIKPNANFSLFQYIRDQCSVYPPFSVLFIVRSPATNNMDGNTYNISNTFHTRSFNFILSCEDICFFFATVLLLLYVKTSGCCIFTLLTKSNISSAILLSTWYCVIPS